MDLLCDFGDALKAVAEICGYGVEKYSERGWVVVVDGIKRYTAAMLRHTLTAQGHMSIDEESGYLHAAHAAWNALARLQLIIDQLKLVEVHKHGTDDDAVRP